MFLLKLLYPIFDLQTIYVVCIIYCLMVSALHKQEIGDKNSKDNGFAYTTQVKVCVNDPTFKNARTG